MLGRRQRDKFNRSILRGKYESSTVRDAAHTGTGERSAGHPRLLGHPGAQPGASAGPAASVTKPTSQLTTTRESPRGGPLLLQGTGAMGVQQPPGLQGPGQSAVVNAARKANARQAANLWRFRERQEYYMARGGFHGPEELSRSLLGLILRGPRACLTTWYDNSSPGAVGKSKHSTHRRHRG